MRGRTPTDDVLLSKDEHKQLAAIMWRWFWRSPGGWPVIISIGVAPLVVFTLLMMVFHNTVQPSFPPGLVMSFILPLALHVVGSSLFALLGGYLATRFAWEPRYRIALREIGYDLCDQCDYRMDGINKSAPCPECGAARDSKDEQPDKSAEPNP